MVSLVQKRILVWIFLSLMFIVESAFGSIEQKMMEIKSITQRLDLSTILQLQKDMVLSEDPRQLSERPTVTCFQANIDDYLLHKHTSSKKIYGCIFSDQVAMNAALLRAGLFIHTDREMASDTKVFDSKMMSAVIGHDFLGKELFKYHQMVIPEEENRSVYKNKKDIEKQFKKEILDKIIDENKEDFIFFAVVNTQKFKEKITHELLHAQYYSVPQIAPLLLEVFKKSLSSQDQKIIINALGNAGYDMQQQALLLREFYSYFLQYSATDYLRNIKALAEIAPLVDIYAPQIRKALVGRGIKILTIN